MLKSLKMNKTIMTNLKRDDFTVTGHLGEGAFGEVSKVVHNITGLEYAMKQINKEELDENQRILIQNEIQHQSVLSELPYICKIRGVFEDSRYIYIVQELCGAELYRLTRNPTYWIEVDINQRVKLFSQLVLAIDSCHKVGIIHLDIKTENVLIDTKGDVSLIDFGLSQHVDNIVGNAVGTIDYLAPELLDDSNPIISPAADCWALGVFLYELICGNLPFFDEKLSIIESKIARAEWDPSCLPPNLQPICIGLFQIDPRKRWNTYKILEYLSTIGFK
jgi:serine/threonine protein kinase